MDQPKILFLDTDEGEFFRRERNKTFLVKSEYLYKKRNILINFLMFLGLYFNQIFLYFTYGPWKKHLDEYELIIMPSRKSCKLLLKILKRKRKKVIVWYWNIVTNEELNPDYCKSNGAKICTFDKNDAKKYNMIFGDQYFFKSCQTNSKDENSTQIFYIGMEKTGRTDIIIDFLNRTGFENNDINIVRNKKIKKNPKINYSKRMPYCEILSRVKKCKAILDINNNGQVGLTLRPLEAMFLKKKLITNNLNIKNYDFYDKNNIFIIGEDPIENIGDFMKGEYKNLPQKITDYYCFENWLDRILKKVGGIE